MQLRSVDPRILIDNLNNPRRTAAHDQQLVASIRDSNGPLQPPTVREQPDGTLTVIYGHRRQYASIAAGLAEIFVLVRGADETGDGMAEFVENMFRTAMCSVDIWRAIEGLVGQGYTEDGISTALSIPVRTIRKLRLFATVLPAMLDRMAQGDQPNECELRTIASARREEQTAAWKKNKPKKSETTSWHMIAHPRARLTEFRSVLQANGYGGFGGLYKGGRVVEAACWAHIQRKFHDIHAEGGASALTREALDQIGKLYAIEERINGAPPDQRLLIRQIEALPLAGRPQALARGHVHPAARPRRVASAIRYALSRWKALVRYVEGGTVAIDNNPVEQAMRLVALGRKNWLFAGSNAGGERATAIYSLIGPPKRMASILKHTCDTSSAVSQTTR